MATTASRESYSPESRVRTSISSMALVSAAISSPTSAIDAGVALGLGHLEQQAGVVEPGAQLLHPADLAGDVRQPGVDLLGPRLVVPQVGGGGLLLELGLVPAQLVDVEDVLDVAQGGVEGFELFGEVGCTHNGQDYAARPRATGRAAGRRTMTVTRPGRP